MTANVFKLEQVPQNRAANRVRRDNRRGQMVETRVIVWPTERTCYRAVKPRHQARIASACFNCGC